MPPKTAGRRGREAAPANSRTQEFVPKTELGRKLMEIRQRAIHSGMEFKTWEEIEREIDEMRRRGDEEG